MEKVEHWLLFVECQWQMMIIEEHWYWLREHLFFWWFFFSLDGSYGFVGACCTTSIFSCAICFGISTSTRWIMGKKLYFCLFLTCTMIVGYWTIEWCLSWFVDVIGSTSKFEFFFFFFGAQNWSLFLDEIVAYITLELARGLVLVGSEGFWRPFFFFCIFHRLIYIRWVLCIDVLHQHL